MDKLRYVDAPLRGQDAGDEETPVLPMEAAQMAAMERKIKCTLPRLDATRAHEVASALETVMSWSTAADGWLRAPGAYTLVRKLVDLFYVRAPWPRTPYLPLLPHYLTNPESAVQAERLYDGPPCAKPARHGAHVHRSHRPRCSVEGLARKLPRLDFEAPGTCRLFHEKLGAVQWTQMARRRIATAKRDAPCKLHAAHPRQSGLHWLPDHSASQGSLSWQARERSQGAAQVRSGIALARGRELAM